MSRDVDEFFPEAYRQILMIGKKRTLASPYFACGFSFLASSLPCPRPKSCPLFGRLFFMEAVAVGLQCN
jgi:hypothetical protein